MRKHLYMTDLNIEFLETEKVLLQQTWKFYMKLSGKQDRSRNENLQQ